jgi:GH18 family chitinase
MMKEYKAAGIKVVVSLFGMMDKPTTQGVDATKFGHTVADWVLKNHVDGVDVDYEDLDAMNKGDGKAEQWVITLTKTLRSKLPSGKYLISHARKCLVILFFS